MADIGELPRPNPEIEPRSKLKRVRIDTSHVPEGHQEEISDAKVLGTGLSLIRYFIHRYKVEHQRATRDERLIGVSNDINRMKELSEEMVEVARSKDPERKKEAILKINSQGRDSLAEFPEDQLEIQTIEAKGALELHILSNVIGSVAHDFKNRVSTVKIVADYINKRLGENIDPSDPEREEQLLKAQEMAITFDSKFATNYASLENFFETTLIEKLENKYPNDELTGIQIRELLDNEALPLLQRDGIKADFEDIKQADETKVVIGEIFLMGFLQNIAQNVGRAYQARDIDQPGRSEEERDLKVRLVVTDDKKLRVIFEDHGPGWPQRVVEQGNFREVASEWDKEGRVEGKGFGMSESEKVLEEHYQGKLIPEYVLENGQRKGARLILELPIK